LILTPRYGTYVFLGEIVTDAIIPCEIGEIKTCEGCMACKRACPANIVKSDCLSALTQKKGTLTLEEQEKILRLGSVWGCDVCQAVCPHNKRALREGTIYTPIPFFAEQTIPHLTSEALNAMTEAEFWPLMEKHAPDMVLLDLGLGGSTTIGVDICASLRKNYPQVKVLIFTGEVLNEKLWVDVLNAGADGIILKTGELLTAVDVQAVMEGKKLVFNYPILEKIVGRFKQSVAMDMRRQEAIITYDIDEYDERLLRHLALGYTKDMITNLKGMPFGVKSVEKRQNELIARLFKPEERSGVNACRLVTRAFELRIIDVDNLEEDEE
jgi:DNA-binding NarL/FixJ family response regulator/NAD-dependent dihydropyrimidine dehydrogenase PreA subunit